MLTKSLNVVLASTADSFSVNIISVAKRHASV